MTTFVLIHGACHGPWHWHALVPELRARGHDAIAPSLPCEDTSAGLRAYADAVLEAVPASARHLVIVGHSLGALTAPVVAARRPARSVVFLAGIVGAPGRSLADLEEIDHDRDLPLADDEIEILEDGTFRFTARGALRALYHDCEPSLAAEAIRRLRRQRSQWAEVSPIASWPDAARHSIVCTRDRIVNPAWSERVARERLGEEPVLLDSGHSPMLSRPAALADLLVSLG